jgi:NTP pyrophosphatase (non-canonical NTP hydrolase)
LEIALCRDLKKMADKDDRDSDKGEETPDSAARYIASLTEELAEIARRHGLETLSYILEMARIEADQLKDHKEQA